MAGLGIKEGVRPPLFDRLSLTHEIKGGRVAASGMLDREGQRESLQRELNRLLNTRSTFSTGKKGQKDERTVVDYGLPDYSAMYTRSTEDQKKLADMVRRTVEAFEPRLGQIKVDAEVLGDTDKTMMVRVSGNLANGRLMERVSFSLQVTGEDLKGGRLGS